MKLYADHGFNEFVLALGYKGHVLRDYFVNHQAMNSDCTVNLKSGNVVQHGEPDCDWQVSLIDTGLNTMTGGRVRRLREYVGQERFLLTYGDGLADIDIKRLLEFHDSHGKMVTVTAVHPIARFGELEFSAGGRVLSFQEKPQTSAGWVNGGFFVCEPQFLELIAGDDTVLEREPLETAAKLGQLMAYEHHGFWHCMDTVRDRLTLQELWESGNAPWSKLTGR